MKVRLLEKETFDTDMKDIIEKRKILTLMIFQNPDLMHFIDDNGVLNVPKEEYEKLHLFDSAEVELVG